MIDEGAAGRPGGRPIIVLGSPRSGTTLLQVMLHSHPRIAIPPENRFVVPVYRDRLSYGDLTDRDNRDRLAQAILARPRQTKFRDFRLDREQIRERIVDDAETVGTAIGIVLRAYSERFGKVRYGD